MLGCPGKKQTLEMISLSQPGPEAASHGAWSYHCGCVSVHQGQEGVRDEEPIVFWTDNIMSVILCSLQDSSLRWGWAVQPFLPRHPTHPWEHTFSFVSTRLCDYSVPCSHSALWSAYPVRSLSRVVISLCILLFTRCCLRKDLGHIWYAIKS